MAQGRCADTLVRNVKDLQKADFFIAFLTKWDNGLENLGGIISINVSLTK